MQPISEFNEESWITLAHKSKMELEREKEDTLLKVEAKARKSKINENYYMIKSR